MKFVWTRTLPKTAVTNHAFRPWDRTTERESNTFALLYVACCFDFITLRIILEVPCYESLVDVYRRSAEDLLHDSASWDLVMSNISTATFTISCLEGLLSKQSDAENVKLGGDSLGMKLSGLQSVTCFCAQLLLFHLAAKHAF